MRRLNHLLRVMQFFARTLFFLGPVAGYAAAAVVDGSTIGTHIRTEYRLVIPDISDTIDIVDKYISSNGLYQAEYQNGREKINIWHLSNKNGTHYQYRSEDGWTKTPILGIELGIAMAKGLDNGLQKMNTDKWQYIGMGKVASLPCKQYRLNHTGNVGGVTNNCIWTSVLKGVAPSVITLSSVSTIEGGVVMSSEVKLVEFSKALDFNALFKVPNDIAVKDNDKESRTRVLNTPECVAAKKKIGFNPCIQDDDDDQDF